MNAATNILILQVSVKCFSDIIVHDPEFITNIIKIFVLIVIPNRHAIDPPFLQDMTNQNTRNNCNCVYFNILRFNF